MIRVYDEASNVIETHERTGDFKELVGMALKQCPECKREISEKAKLCPHCGFQRPRSGLSPDFVTFLILVAAAIAAVAIMIVVQNQKTERAWAKFNGTTQRADRAIAVYRRVYSSATPANRKIERVNKPVIETKPLFVTLRQTVSVPLPYGTVTLPAGTRLEFVSSDSSEVHVRYMNTEQAIPISAVDWRTETFP